MRHMVLVVALLLATGCATKKQKEELHHEYRMDWMKENPGEALTPEIDDQLRKKADDDMEDEASDTRDELKDQGKEAVSKFASGNYVGGGLTLFGMLVTTIGFYFKRKEEDEEEEE